MKQLGFISQSEKQPLNSRVLSDSESILRFVESEKLLTQAGNQIKKGEIKLNFDEIGYEEYMNDLLNLLDKDTANGSIKPASNHIFHFALSDLIFSNLNSINSEYKLPKDIHNRQKFYVGLFRTDNHLGQIYYGYKELMFPENEKRSAINNASRALMDMTPNEIGRFGKFKFNQIMNTSLKRNAEVTVKGIKMAINKLKNGE